MAVNDWSVPCTQGKCSWDLPADSGASGTVHIWGPSTAISDITTATGWRITSCDPVSTTQDIQLVCEGNNPDCDHLFQGGAVHTIVRLPDSCGPMPFARVAQHQVLQRNLSSRGVRQNAVAIHTISLDTNYTAITPSQNGSVNFSLQGVNVKSAPATAASVRRRHWRARSRDSSHRDVSVHQRNLITDGLNALKDANTFNQDLSKDPQPVDFTGSTNLLQKSIQCALNTTRPISASASVSLDASANVHATIGMSAVAVGTFVPPSLSQFGLNFALDGTIDADLSIAANVTGKVSSGSIPLFQVGIPGLTFPGILEIGPQFKVTGQIDASLEVSDIEASVGLNYDLSGVTFAFPPQANSQGGSFTPGTSQVTASTNPDVGLTFKATGHLIPEFDIGLSAFGGVASSTVFVKLDASTAFTIATSTADITQACASASTTLDVGVGAQASFFNLFDASVVETLFNQNFPLLQHKCFGGASDPSPGGNSAIAVRAPVGAGIGTGLTNVVGRRHNARQAFHAPHGRSVVPVHPRAVTLGCPLSPSRVKVDIKESVP